MYKCGNITYDLGCKLTDSTIHAKCSRGSSLAGLGIRWVKASRFLPHLTNFKNFTRKEIIEAMQDDINELVKNKEYEKVVEALKRLEKIHDEL